jgi:hypothetical protein
VSMLPPSFPIEQNAPGPISAGWAVGQVVAVSDLTKLAELQTVSETRTGLLRHGVTLQPAVQL